MKLLLAFLFLVATVAASAQQWTRLDVHTTAGFRGLSVVSEKVVWASGTDSTVIRTVDGGKKWSVMHVAEPDRLDFRGIHAFDAMTAVIISSGPAEKGQAHIYRTGNGGKLWSQVFEVKTPGVFFDAIAFWDAKHGIVLSDPVNGHFLLFTTDDGGLTWRQLQPKSLPAALPTEGAFAASNSCLTVQGANDVWFSTGGGSVARVFHSADRGQNWTVAETPMHPANASSGIFSLHFSDAQSGIAVGGDYQHPESSDLPNVLRTGDGGRTWQSVGATQPEGAYISAIAPLGLPSRADFVLVGSTGMFMRTILSQGQWGKVGEGNLNTVAVVSSPEGLDIWAVGAKGIVVKSSMAFLDRIHSAHVAR